MNKRLLTLSMVGLLTVTLASCSDVKKKTVVGNDGKKQEVIVSVKDTNYTADDLLTKYSTTADGVKAYYDAIYDVLVRNQQEITNEITSDVNSELDSFTKEVKSNAASNGKTYKAELSAELEEKGVESLADYKEILTLNHQKTKYEEKWYRDRLDYEENKDTLIQSYIKSSLPYHVKHILVKTENAGSSLYEGKVSEAEALKLSSVIERLAADNESFGQIAQQASDDTGSASLYGSIGVVDLDAKSSFVNEFKYGVYAYDAFLDAHAGDSSVVENKEARAAALNIPETITYSSLKTQTTKTFNVKNMVTSVEEIPYKAVEDLRDYSDKIKTEGNLTYVPKAGEWGAAGDPAHIEDRQGLTIDENYYPRNVIFNNYFNDHGLSVITDEGFTGTSNRFKSIPALSATHKVLCDEKGNPILVTRAGSGDSYQGVHFMIIEQSPFWYDETQLEYTKLSGSTPTTMDYLRYYYSTNVPTTSSAKVNNDLRYVTFIKSTRDKYEERANEFETDIVKKYNSNISYEMWNTLVEDTKDNVKIDEKIMDSINKMIAASVNSAKASKEQSNIASWKSYVELLNLQDEEKEAKQISLDYIRMYDSSYTK